MCTARKTRYDVTNDSLTIKFVGNYFCHQFLMTNRCTPSVHTYRSQIPRDNFSKGRRLVVMATDISETRKKTAQCKPRSPWHLSPRANNSDLVKALTTTLGVFIGADMQPLSAVQNPGFKYTLKVNEPRYDVSSHPHFSQQVIPALSKPLSLV